MRVSKAIERYEIDDNRSFNLVTIKKSEKIKFEMKISGGTMQVTL